MPHSYEWLIEGLAGPDSDDVEIIDVQHSDKLSEALSFASHYEHARVAVVVDRNDGVRAWAYPKNGVLPSVMLDSYDREICRTPVRFLNEWRMNFLGQ